MERVSYHRSARRELNEAAQYYNIESPGLGLAFLDEVERCTQAILQFPESGSSFLERSVAGWCLDFPTQSFIPSSQTISACSPWAVNEGVWAEPVRSLCSRNARPEKALVGRAHVESWQTTPPLIGWKGKGQSPRSTVQLREDRLTHCLSGRENKKDCSTKARTTDLQDSTLGAEGSTNASSKS